MPLLVDVVNVLHVTGILPPELAGPDEVALAGLIARSRWRTQWIRLVCDGGVPGEQTPFPGLDLVLRHTGARSADDVIVDLAEKSSFARRITVITNDRGLIDRTRRVGCRSMSGESFLERLAIDAKRPRAAHHDDARSASARTTDVQLSPDSVDAWMRAFGFDPPSAKE